MYMPDQCSTCSEMGVSFLQLDDIQWNNETHAIKLGQRCITFTPTEYRLIFPLRSGMPTTYAQLAQLAYRYTLDEKVRAMMDKHIDRIRGKVKGTGIYIYCILGYGYILLLDTSEEEDIYYKASTAKISQFSGNRSSINREQ